MTEVPKHLRSDKPHDHLHISASGQDARDLLAALMGADLEEMTIPAAPAEDGEHLVSSHPLNAIDAGPNWAIDLPDDLSVLSERAGDTRYAMHFPNIWDVVSYSQKLPPPLTGWTRYRLIITGEKWEADDE